MAKQSEKAKSKEQKEIFMLRVIVAVLVLLLLYLWMAWAKGWWPFMQDSNLGTAFSSSEQSKAATEAGAQPATGSGGTSGSGGSSSSGSGSGGGTTTPGSSSSSRLITFASGINSGDTKESVSGDADGLNEQCSLVVNSSSQGKQEVCVYTEGDKIVTVTYQDDHVVSASRRGF